LGDYILPSGEHNGYGIAISPENMLASDFKRVVGIAWSEAKTAGINTVNVAVGLNANALSTIVDKQQAIIANQQAQIQSMQSSLEKTNSALASLVPGFAEKMAENQQSMSKIMPATQIPAQAKKEVMTKERAKMIY
jgi:predicted metal-dependent hydrolase